MLKTLRAGAGNLFVKVLLSIVALSFVLWGVGDIFRGSSARNVAVVGEKPISFENYNQTLQREIARYGQLFGHALTEAEINALNLRQQVLLQLVQEQLLNLRVSDLELVVGEKVIRDRIAATPVFQTESGAFDKERFRSILQSNGLTEEYYVNALKKDLAVGFLVNAVVESEAPVDRVADRLYAARNEERIADLLVIPADYTKSVPEPSNAELLEYYNNNPQMFSVPELRNLSYVTLSLDAIEGEVSLSNDQLQAWYEARQGNYAVTEKRRVEQLLFDSEDIAMATYKKLEGGEDAVAAIDLGDVTKDGMPGVLGATIFALDEGVYSEPVQSELGWHIFRVTQVKPSHVPAFEDIKTTLAKDAKEEGGSDAFYQFTTQVEDDIASGVSLADIAAKYQLTLETITGVSRQGRSLGGDKVQNIPEAKVFLQAAFNTEQGEVSSLTLLPESQDYVLVAVESVQPQRVQALDEVRGRAVLSWKDMKREELLRNFAQELAAKVSGEAEISKLSALQGLRFLAQRTLKQPTNGGTTPYPSAFFRDLFTLKPSQTTEAYRMNDGGYVIGRLQQTVEITDENVKEREGYDVLVEELKENFSNELMEQYLAHLEVIYPLDINENALAPSVE